MIRAEYLLKNNKALPILDYSVLVKDALQPFIRDYIALNFVNDKQCDIMIVDIYEIGGSVNECVRYILYSEDFELFEEKEAIAGMKKLRDIIEEREATK
jgi:hypothetical protein